MQDEVESGSPPPQSTPENEAPPLPPQEKQRRRRRRKRWTTIERDLRLQKGPLLAGVDEVGRGPIAGPVVACAVIMPPDTRAIAGVDDSKRLTHDQRVRLAVKIRERAVAYALGAASVREIDTINIYQASVLAMQRALTRLRIKPDHVVIDGRAMRTLPIPHTAVVRGDRRCFSVACASILAKVTRDLLMTRLGQRYPHYIWDHNAGYTTREHVIGLTSHGITAHHRKSFCRISDLLLELEHQTQLEDRERLALDDVGIPDEDDLDDELFDDVELDGSDSDGDDDSDQQLEQRS
ncbi:MAG TPA: ribonuclease HII [Gemmatimonadaceae bacterium]|nr:ribonuclease HII [Gemmatimonadaceae bacterium]